MGLVIFMVMGAYLLISFGVVAWAISYAKKSGKGAIRWGMSAALVMFLIPCWDWIPTVVVHKYYCEKEAGFWVYKTLEEWKAENPGEIEGLVSYNRNPSGFNVSWPFQYELTNDGHTKKIISHINERFDVPSTQQDISDLFPIIREENLLWDKNKNQVIARYVDFGTGNSVKNTVGPPGPLKFWLNNSSCMGGKEKQIDFGIFYIQFKGTEK
ncbi:MAG: hypothetical protein PHI11_11140 [Gallionella sp.]|nr:hypothetical protein [Gallionella sp.]